MADRPIIFSGPMVRALIEGRKTQTRRVLKPQPKVLKNGIWYRAYPVLRPLHWNYLHGDRIAGFADLPYATGDRLYVREAHSLHNAHGTHRDDGKRWGPWGGLPTAVSPDGEQIAYYREGFDRCGFSSWRPSIHMPRWASRLTLTVTDVRVQRLQEISASDSIAEGVQCSTCQAMKESACHRRGCFASVEAFRALWNNLHGPEAWTANPWVVALTFTAERRNIDAVGA